MKNTLFLFSLIVITSSCTSPVINEEIENTPINNFNILWNELDQHYGLFAVRGWNWDSVRVEYTDKISDETTDTELWAYLTESIEYLDDTHTVLHSYQTDSTFRSGATLNNLAIEEFSIDLVEKLYLSDLQAANPENRVLYSDMEDRDIGYIHINSFNGYDEESIEVAIDALWSKKAIIVDIRNARGGTDIIAERLAGAFSDGEHFVYSSQSRNGPDHTDFDSPLKQYTKLGGERQYTKPTILLTDRKTISAAEEFTLHMKAFQHVTQIGDFTAGDMSDVSPARFLPIGWVYVYSYQQYLLPDGSSIDGIGATPDYYVKNSKLDIENENDKVMERSLQFLKEEYGIE